MFNAVENNKHENPRVLMFSQRNIYKHHFRSPFYEFEDLICNLDSVELVAPSPGKWFKYGTRAAQRLASENISFINPGIKKLNIKKSYDLFFAGATFIKDLLNINCIEGWRDRCKIAVCWVEEIWISRIYKSRHFLKFISQFDHVIVNCKKSVDVINQVIGDKCYYLPPGIDTILFCPYPDPPHRFIDVLSIGRRSEETHRSLLAMADRYKKFYFYDSIVGDIVPFQKQHRFLYANMAKRSNYFIANRSKIDEPENTKEQVEIGPRYFEGAASGAIMIGEHPKSEEFEKIFGWEDLIIHLPFGSDGIFEVMNDLDAQPDRKRNIRKRNVAMSIKRHDWIYRWEEVLKISGLDFTPGILERKNRLDRLSKSIENISISLLPHGQ